MDQGMWIDARQLCKFDQGHSKAVQRKGWTLLFLTTFLPLLCIWLARLWIFVQDPLLFQQFSLGSNSLLRQSLWSLHHASALLSENINGWPVKQGFCLTSAEAVVKKVKGVRDDWLLTLLLIIEGIDSYLGECGKESAYSGSVVGLIGPSGHAVITSFSSYLCWFRLEDIDGKDFILSQVWEDVYVCMYIVYIKSVLQNQPISKSCNYRDIVINIQGAFEEESWQ